VSLRGNAIRKSSSWLRHLEWGNAEIENIFYCGAVKRTGERKYAVAIMNQHGPADRKAILTYKIFFVTSLDAAERWVRKQLEKLRES